MRRVNTRRTSSIQKQGCVSRSKSRKSDKGNAIQSLGALRLYPRELLDKYVDSPQIREYIDTDRYVFVEGYIVLKSPECVEISNGRIILTKKARSRLEDYCVSGEYVSRTQDVSAISLPKNVDNRGSHKKGRSKNDLPGSSTGQWSIKRFCCRYAPLGHSVKAERNGRVIEVSTKPPIQIVDAKKFSEISPSEWEQLISIGTVYSIPDEFDKALVYLMTEINMGVERLAETTGLSEKTIVRLRNGNNTPSLATVVAICIGLCLDPATSEKLINVAGYCLGGKKRDRAYKLLLGIGYTITIDDANEFLSNLKLPKLSKNYK